MMMDQQRARVLCKPVVAQRDTTQSSDQGLRGTVTGSFAWFLVRTVPGIRACVGRRRRRYRRHELPPTWDSTGRVGEVSSTTTRLVVGASVASLAAACARRLRPWSKNGDQAQHASGLLERPSVHQQPTDNKAEERIFTLFKGRRTKE